MQLQRNQGVVTGKTMVRGDFSLQTVSQFRSSQRRTVSLVRIMLRGKGLTPPSPSLAFYACLIFCTPETFLRSEFSWDPLLRWLKKNCDVVGSFVTQWLAYFVSNRNRDLEECRPALRSFFERVVMCCACDVLTLQ